LESRSLLSASSGGDLLAFGAAALPPNADTLAAALIPQSDGGAVAVGRTSGPSSQSGIYLARFGPQGTLEANFGTGGIVTIPLVNGLTKVIAAGQSSDGTMTVLTTILNIVPKKPNFATTELIRFNNNGTLDLHFGHRGTIVMPATLLQDAASMAVAADGVVTVAGQHVLAAKRGESSTQQPAAFEILQYTARGRLNGSFGAGGKTRAHVEFSDVPTTVLVGEDGSVSLVGTAAAQSTPGNPGRAMLRFDSRGRGDTLFGSKGILLAGEAPPVGTAALGMNGDLLVAHVNNGQFQVVDYTATGQINPFFGNGGIASITPTNPADVPAFVNAMSLSSDGKITLVGDVAVQFTVSPAVAPNFYPGFITRLNSTGTIDPTFAENGQLIATGGAVSFDTFPSAFAIGSSVYLAGLTGSQVGELGIAIYSLPSSNNDVVVSAG